MFARLRDLRVNIEYKLLALVCAFALHYYVASLTHPQRSRTLTVTLNPLNLPSDMLFGDNGGTAINVTVDGAVDDIDRLSESNLVAYVDLKRSHAGVNDNLKVSIHIPTSTGGEVTVADIEPAEVSVVLTPKSHRTMRVTTTYPGTPPVGYGYRTPVIDPELAMVAGSRDAVASVNQLVVKPDMSGEASTVDDEVPVIPLDSAGNQVNDITVEPSTARVRIGIVKVPASKALIVSPSITGIPPFPYKITDVQVIPQSSTVSGPADILAKISTASTSTVDVSASTADVVRDVDVIPPDGTSVSGDRHVRVTVRIGTTQPLEGVPPAAPQK